MTLHQGVRRKVATVSEFRLTGRLLGKGNFARVEEAIHSLLNLKVAIKIIDIREVKEKYVVRNLHREARIMSTLNHPCIAALFQTMQLADNVYYLITELITGGDLCSFIVAQRFGKLEERSSRIYARQFASALSHMHSFGIVHRDLKMENVILNSTKTQIKIVDFGLSNVWTSDNPLRTHCGSPEYAAPELFIAGREYGPEVDLWSLGIIFYGMVVGQLPFIGGRKNQLSSQERRKRLVAQINKGLGTLQRQAIAPLSLEFRTMLNKLLTTDPTKRITIKGLIIHPWITEKGRKFVQTHPLKKVDSQLSAKFTKQISDVCHMDQNAVTTEIAKNPFGRLGGMYNMLTYTHTTERFNPDHIALHNAHIKTENSTVKNIITKPKSAPLPKSQHTLYNQCIVLLNKVSKQQIEQRAKTASATTSVTSKNMTRLSRSKIDHPQVKSATTKQNYSKMNSFIINRKIQENSTCTPRTLRKTISSRLQSVENKLSNSGTANTRRPYTTGTTRGAPRPPKRSSLSTAMPMTSIPNSQEFSRRRVSLNPAEMGDTNFAKKVPPFNVASQKNRQRDPLVNDPIARSIAGYLIKNVPDKMLKQVGACTKCHKRPLEI